MNAILEQINLMGRTFVEFAGPMLIQSSVLIAILLLADFVLRRKVRAVFRYWLWMLVLVKLVLPTSLTTPVSLGHWFGDELQYVQTDYIPAAVNPAPVPQLAEAGPVEISGEVLTPAPMTREVEPAAAEAGAEAAVAMTPVTWQGVVFLAWLAGVIAMGLLLLQRAIFVVGLVAQAKGVNGLMGDTLKYCCSLMGVRGKIGLRVSANATSPAVCGLFRPVILVPQDLGPNLGAGGLRVVLMHELAHIRRGDLWVNLVQTVLQIIYFYNPLLWLANVVIRRVREQAVDEAVQVAMGEKAGQYPETLVSVAKLTFERPALSLRLIGVVESKSTLQARVKRMLERPLPKSTKLGFLGLAMILIIGAVLLPMAKAKENQKALRGIDEKLNVSDKGGELTINSLYMTSPDGKGLLGNSVTLSVGVTNNSQKEIYLGFEYYTDSGTVAKVFSPGASSLAQIRRVASNWQGQIEFPIRYNRFVKGGYVRITLAKCSGNRLKETRLAFLPVDSEVLHKKKYVIFPREKEKASKEPTIKKFLPNGVTVELVGVCEHFSMGKKWWRPDGSLVEVRPYLHLGYSMSSVSQKVLEVAFKTNMSDNEIGFTINERESGGLVHPLNDNPIEDIWAGCVRFDKDVEKGSFLLGVATGRWTIICRSPAEGSSGQSSSEGDFTWGQFYQENESAVIPVTHNIRKRQQDYRVVAIDTSGNTHPSWGKSYGSSNDWTVTTSKFRNLTVEKIKEFQFQTRPYEWVEFKNVSLKPNFKTAVEIEAENPAVEVGERQVPPIGDYALEFDGIDDYLEIHASESLQLGRHFTIQMWIKPEFPETSTPDKERNLLSKGGYVLGHPDEKGRQAKSYGFGFKLIPEGESQIHFEVCSASHRGIHESTVGFSKPSDWLHLAVVFDGEKGRVYRGVIFGLGEETYEPAPNSNIIVGGKFLIPMGNYFKGQIAELRIWNQALSFDEIAQLKNMALNGNEPNLVGCWTFEQTEGQRAIDISPYKNRARLGSTYGVDNSDPTWVRVETEKENEKKPAVRVEGEEVEEAGYAVTGRVLTSPGGEAAAGAIVNLWHGGDGKTRTTEADADGLYLFKHVKPGKFYYVLRIKNPPGIWTDWNIIHVSDKNIEDKDLYLTLPQSISGTVRDVETSEPISGVEIIISTDNGRNAGSMRTDVNGKFHLYVNQPEVKVRCEGTEDRYYPKEESMKKFEVQPGQNLEDIDFKVISAPKFTGQVIYADGRPAENIPVDVSLSWSGGKNVPHSFVGAFGFGRTFHLKSDTEGRFTGYLRRPVGMRDWHPNIKLKGVARVPHRSLSGGACAETKTTASEVVSMKIVLEKTGSAKIRVIDPDGRPIRTARVTASNIRNVFDPDADESGKYLGDGQYHITNLIPNLDYYITALASGYRPGMAEKFILESGEDFDAGTLTLDWWGKKAVEGVDEIIQASEFGVSAEKGLQGLIDAAKTGETVIVPEGVYTEPIRISKSLRLKGQSPTGSVFEVTANEPAIFVDTKGKGRVTIEGVTIKWQLATSDKNIEHPFAVAVKDTKAEVKNCNFVPLGNPKRSPVAIRAMGFSNLNIEACRFEGFEYVVCYGEGTNGTMSDSLIMDCGHQGVILYSGAKVKIIRNIITGSKYHAVRSTGGTLDVKDNLIIENANRGIYLGNKSARGAISNNIIMGNGTGISGFARSKVRIQNNIIADSGYAGISMRDSCSLLIRNNILQGNAKGWILYKEGSRNANTVYRNTFWQNEVDAENFNKTANSISAEPGFVDSENGDFSLKAGPALEHNQGLSDPNVFKVLWKRWKNRDDKNEPFNVPATKTDAGIEAKEL